MQTIETTWDEFFPIVNILNEVCHGIDINNFQEEIGFDYEEIFLLLKKINRSKTLDDNEQIEIELNTREIEIIKRSFKEVVRQIEEWEFQNSRWGDNSRID